MCVRVRTWKWAAQKWATGFTPGKGQDQWVNLWEVGCHLRLLHAPLRSQWLIYFQLFLRHMDSVWRGVRAVSYWHGLNWVLLLFLPRISCHKLFFSTHETFKNCFSYTFWNLLALEVFHHYPILPYSLPHFLCRDCCFPLDQQISGHWRYINFSQRFLW